MAGLLRIENGGQECYRTQRDEKEDAADHLVRQLSWLPDGSGNGACFPAAAAALRCVLAIQR